MTAQHDAVGKDTEQRVARWLRDEGGFPHAERTVRTGYRTAGREVVDAGDIDGTPGIVWQVKSMRPADRAERCVGDWLIETERQRQAARAAVGLLVVRRWGTTVVGRWWAFFTAGALTDLTGGHSDLFLSDTPVPVRLEVQDAVRLLRTLGYGGPA